MAGRISWVPKRRASAISTRVRQPGRRFGTDAPGRAQALLSEGGVALLGRRQTV